MQKIGFCDKYSLTQAVLNGTKTMTRRLEKGLENLEEGNFYFNRATCEIYLYGEKGTIIERIKTRYKLNEVVAVAQNYNDAAKEAEFNTHDEALSLILLGKQRASGWSNKMFVRADLMPHQIQITGIRIEKLQAISDDDCLKEGVTYDSRHWVNGYKVAGLWNKYLQQSHWRSPREAFADLINRPGVGRKGLWESNPWVVVYEFKLVK